MTVTSNLVQKWVHIHYKDELLKKMHLSIIGKGGNLPTFSESEEHLLGLLDQMEASGARQWALKKIAAQPVLSQQLEKSLRERGVSPSTIEQIISDFKRVGYLNDEEWIASFVRVQKMKRVGPQMIVQKLKMKGVPAELIAPYMEDDSTKERIKELLKSKYARRDLTDYKEKQKVVASLARKGYSFEDVFQVIEQL